MAPPVLYFEGQQALFWSQRIPGPARHGGFGLVHDRQVGRLEIEKAPLVRNIHARNVLFVVRGYGIGKGRLDWAGWESDCEVQSDVLSTG
jgi:hypothetical protein